MTHPPAPSRLTNARRTAIAALITLIPTVLIHELISFGLIRPLIHWSDAGCISGEGCAGIAVVLVLYVMLALPVALIFGVAGAVLCGFRGGNLVLAAIWLVTCVWSLMSVASGYRGAFGATWRWHEPFVELMAHPIATPLLILAGLSAFVAMLSRTARGAA